MRYPPNASTANCSQQMALIPYALRRPQQLGWQVDLTALLLLRAAVAYRLLADRALALANCGRVVRLVHNSVVCICELRAFCL